MQPFNQTESAYTATAKTVAFSASDAYDLSKLDNPVRKKLNATVVRANAENYTRAIAL
jgi:hypothetical protein